MKTFGVLVAFMMIIATSKAQRKCKGEWYIIIIVNVNSQIPQTRNMCLVKTLRSRETELFTCKLLIFLNRLQNKRKHKVRKETKQFLKLLIQLHFELKVHQTSPISLRSSSQPLFWKWSPPESIVNKQHFYLGQTLKPPKKLTFRKKFLLPSRKNVYGLCCCLSVKVRLSKYR